MSGQQQFTRINTADPRYKTIKQELKGQFGRGTTISDENIKEVYYTAGGANRRGQITRRAYAQLVEATMSNQPNQPIRVLQQTAGIHTISINDVARTMEANGNGYDFIHFRRVDMSAQTRLYIPAHLAHVDEFFNALWQLSGLTGFKIAGFKDAQDRSDVIVAWFQHSMHAQAVGANLDQTMAPYFSGVYPPGSHPCSGAQHCGWSVEEPDFSVGTESTQYLTAWWIRKGGTVT